LVLLERQFKLARIIAAVPMPLAMAFVPLAFGAALGVVKCNVAQKIRAD
jgi:hypothetical protein